MARHLFTPDDLALLRWAEDAQVSPDGTRVAWCETSFDRDGDDVVSHIMVAPAGGDGPPRTFSSGPHDRAPRWSPDGRWLAYLTAGEASAALVLAPLEGGAAAPVTAPGAVLAAEWSPSGRQMVLVVNVGPDTVANAPRVVRGLYSRLDGRGWLEGRDHLCTLDVATAAVRQLTTGEFDHSSPAWSPDGSTIAFLSDRDAACDDRVGHAELWVVAAKGGRPRRLTRQLRNGGHPAWSPDGARIAFTGRVGAGPMAGLDTHLHWIAAGPATARPPAAGAAGRGGRPAAAAVSAEPTRVAPDLDRPTGFTLTGRCFAWLSPDELAFTVTDRGTTGIHRATLDAATSTPVLGGDTQVLDLHVSAGTLAYSAAWLDQTAEVHCGPLGDGPVGDQPPTTGRPVWGRPG